MIQLPERFEEKMQCLLGSEFEEYIRCYEEPRYYTKDLCGGLPENCTISADTDPVD